MDHDDENDGIIMIYDKNGKDIKGNELKILLNQDFKR